MKQILTLILLLAATLAATAQIPAYALEKANQGDAESQLRVSHFYYYGWDGVPKNHAKALEWCKKAAEQDHKIAQYELGCMYERGEGTRPNADAAMYWYTKSAENGYPSAFYTLGLKYSSSNPDYAEYWLKRTAEYWYNNSGKVLDNVQKTLDDRGIKYDPNKTKPLPKTYAEYSGKAAPSVNYAPSASASSPKTDTQVATAIENAIFGLQLDKATVADVRRVMSQKGATLDNELAWKNSTAVELLHYKKAAGMSYDGIEWTSAAFHFDREGKLWWVILSVGRPGKSTEIVSWYNKLEREFNNKYAKYKFHPEPGEWDAESNYMDSKTVLSIHRDYWDVNNTTTLQMNLKTIEAYIRYVY